MKRLYKMIKSCVIISLFLLLHTIALGQAEKIDLKDNYNDLSWIEFVSKLEHNYSVRFFYDIDSIPDIQIKISKNGTSFYESLNEILKPYGFNATFDSEGNIFVVKHEKIRITFPDKFLSQKKDTANTEYIEIAEESLEDKYLRTDKIFTNITKTVGVNSNDNKPYAVVSGYIKSLNNDLPIVGGVLQIEENGRTTVTDGNGFFTFKLKKGDYTLIITSIESKEERIKLNVLSDGRVDIGLEPKLIALDEIVVSSEKEQVVRSTQMGYQKLVAKDVKEIPLVLGERDIVKISLLLPGIQSVGEGSAGLNVRGSPTDENLFTINNVSVYNSSHLFGFFSAFNSDAIKDFSLYKSNIPANYGGRLAAIFDIKTKQGNQNNFTASGGISPVTARLIVEGPILKKKSSYMIGIRSTYSDWLLKQVKDPDIKNSNAQFADVVTNFAFELNKNNQLQMFSYHSYDNINLIDKNKYEYSNNGASLSWNHIIKEKHIFQLALIYSQYNFNEENSEIAISSYKDNFELKHSEVKASFIIRPGLNHTVTAGINSSLYQLDQGNFLPLTNESLVLPVDLGDEQALESGFFISDEWVISPKITLVGGLRFNNYLYLGPRDVAIYTKGAKTNESIIDTLSYSDKQIIESYSAPDVRFAARYILTDNLSLKLSFNQLKQYLFMLSNTIAISPTDKWKLTDSNIKPMSGNQYSFGIYSTIFSGKYDISLETYYKTVKNLVEYKDGANLVVNERPEIDVLQGDLNSYGLELMIKKTYGRFNGWLNYTYSRALVTVNSDDPEERINYGETYPSNYDKPHAINLVANYKFSRRFSISSNLVYSTGRPITYPVGLFYQNNQRLPLYSKRNEYRIPDYFRVDLSVKFEGNLAAKKIAHGTWIFSIYNLTGRKNAYSVYFKSEEELLKGYKLSIFGVPIVSLTYSFKLGNYAN